MEPGLPAPVNWLIRIGQCNVWKAVALDLPPFLLSTDMDACVGLAACVARLLFSLA